MAGILFFVIFQAIMFRKIKFFQDVPNLLFLIFLFGYISFSAKVKVNLWAAFRQRLILLVPPAFYMFE